MKLGQDLAPLFSIQFFSRKNVIWNLRRLQLLGQYLGPLLEIYLDIQREHISESQKDEMNTYFMVCYFGDVLAKYLNMYWESDIDLYLYSLLKCVSKPKMDLKKD